MSEIKRKNLPLKLETAEIFEATFRRWKSRTGKGMEEFCEIVITRGVLYLKQKYLNEFEKEMEGGKNE